MNRTVIFSLVVIVAITITSSLLFKGSSQSQVESLDATIVEPKNSEPIVIQPDSLLEVNEEAIEYEDTIEPEDQAIAASVVSDEDSIDLSNEINSIYENEALQAELFLESAWTDEQLTSALEQAALAEEEYFNEGEYAEELSISDPVKYQELLKQADEAETSLFREIPYEDQEKLRQVADEQEKNIVFE